MRNRTAKAGFSAGAALMALAAALFISGRAEAGSACGSIVTNAVNGYMQYTTPAINVRTTYNASAYVQVVCPVVALTKQGPWREASSGTTFAFTVCLSNETSDTVWSLVITDALPQNLVFRGWPYNVWTGGNYQTSTAVPTLTQTYSDSLAGPWTAGTPADGQDAPLYLRWEVSFVGGGKSACVVYSVEIL